MTMRLALLSCVVGVSALAQSPGTFTATGGMTTPRFGHTATVLPNGKVLIAGGRGRLVGTPPDDEVLASAELYDPSTGVFTPTGNMITARAYHSATLLPDGRVFIIGGAGPSAELYDPSTGTFTATGGTSTVWGIATLLKNGKVLIAGKTAELYDPVTDTFAPTGSYIGPFYYGPFFYPDTATLLQDGKVLVVGSACGDCWLEHEELYDPVTGTFKVVGQPYALPDEGYIGGAHTATLLPNGKVLLAGGGGYSDTFSRAELYDPSTDTLTGTANMTLARVWHTATLLADGNVLVTGGQLYPSNIDAAELYNPATGKFSATGHMTIPRAGHSATLLFDGRVLTSGGVAGTGNGDYLASAELYHSLNVPSTPTVQIVDNNTGSLTTLAVGDSFSFQVSGAPPLSLVSVSEVGWSGSVGYTDASGLFFLNGIVGSNVVGTWQQTWTIGGVLAQPSPLQFTITPKP